MNRHCRDYETRVENRKVKQKWEKKLKNNHRKKMGSIEDKGNPTCALVNFPKRRPTK